MKRPGLTASHNLAAFSIRSLFRRKTCTSGSSAVPAQPVNTLRETNPIVLFPFRLATKGTPSAPSSSPVGITENCSVIECFLYRYEKYKGGVSLFSVNYEFALPLAFRKGQVLGWKRPIGNLTSATVFNAIPPCPLVRFGLRCLNDKMNAVVFMTLHHIHLLTGASNLLGLINKFFCELQRFRICRVLGTCRGYLMLVLYHSVNRNGPSNAAALPNPMHQLNFNFLTFVLNVSVHHDVGPVNVEKAILP